MAPSGQPIFRSGPSNIMRRLLSHNPKLSSAALFLAVAGVAAHQMWMSAKAH